MNRRLTRAERRRIHWRIESDHHQYTECFENPSAWEERSCSLCGEEW
jgi:hypothetical protein